MVKPGYFALRLSSTDDAAIAIIAQARGLDPDGRGVKARIIRDAVQRYADEYMRQDLAAWQAIARGEDDGLPDVHQAQ